MATKPYSIYLNHRPFRVAFFVNPSGDQVWFDRIFEYSREKWGGRFFTIILTDGKIIEEKWWKMLRDYDPDFIIPTVELSEELRKKIHIFLSPLSVGEAYPDYIRLEKDPISILPNSKNVRIVAGIGGEKSKIVLFELEEGTPEIIKLFLERNFGVLNYSKMYPSHLKESLDECEKQIYKVKDLGSLNDALLDLGEFHNQVVFPTQICAIPNSFKDCSYDYNNEKFTIIIGDTADEIAYLWNRTMKIPNWMRKDVTQIWLPTELANNAAIKSGLNKFINRYVLRTGNSNQRGADFVTFSLSGDEIKRISSTFSGVVYHPITSQRYDEPQIPNFREGFRSIQIRTGSELYRAHSEEEHLILTEPNIEEGSMGGQHWFADLYIQFRPERFTHIIGRDYWWQLPRRNHLCSYFFNKPSRINEEGGFSVLLERQSRFDPGFDKGVLIIKLPEDGSVFRSLICGESYDYFHNNERDRFLSNPFYDIQRSDKGMYFSGILSLFPGLSEAGSFLKERYWRNIFEKMSNQNPNKDEEKKKENVFILKKAIHRGRDFNKQEDLEWLAQKILIMAKGHAKKEVDLSFEDFAKEGEKETDEYNKKLKTHQISFDKNGLNELISDLINWSILLLGVKPRCPRCGYNFWYHINELEQKTVCKGCGLVFSIDAEERWYYRLNSLVRAAFSFHGTVPVLLTVDQLSDDARSFFSYIPSVDLFTRTKGEKEEKLYGELDLVCIKDGRFIIGEIKQSAALFGPEDFDKMKDIALLLKPDEVLFTSLDKEPPEFVKKKIDKLKSELSHLEINVRWYPLHSWNFEASPVR